MKISGFTYVRNGLTYDYPFVEAIQSILPVCDEFIAVVGNSSDGTREAIAAMKESRVKIVDSIWDEHMNTMGRRYAQQANIGLDHVTGDWAFHIQADEVVHEQDLSGIKRAMEKYFDNKKIDGFLFRFINFFGDYNHFAPSRRFHQREIRIVRNDPHIRSYRDSQGFRKFENPADQWNQKGSKLDVISLNARIFHYSHARNPYRQRKRQIEFEKGWIPNEVVEKKYAVNKNEAYDYSNIDYLELFEGDHPGVMDERIGKQDWEFKYDPSCNNMIPKEKILRLLEKLTGRQFFIYKNYKIVKL